MKRQKLFGDPLLSSVQRSEWWVTYISVRYLIRLSCSSLLVIPNDSIKHNRRRGISGN